MAKSKKKKQQQEEEVLVDIVEVRDQAQSFLDRYQYYLFGALVGLVLIIGGIFAYNNFYKKPRQQEAQQEIVQAQRLFEKDSFALALTNPGGGNLGFLDLADEYGGVKAGNLAELYSGLSYLNIGEFDAAISYLEGYKPKDSVTPIIRFGALGDAYSELGDFDKALNYYRRAANYSDNELLTPYYLQKMGMLHESQGNSAAAAQAYQEIKDKYPDSPAGRQIDKYLVRVEQ